MGVARQVPQSSGTEAHCPTCSVTQTWKQWLTRFTVGLWLCTTS